jgi:hypothetical protein
VRHTLRRLTAIASVSLAWACGGSQQAAGTGAPPTAQTAPSPAAAPPTASAAPSAAAPELGCPVDRTQKAIDPPKTLEEALSRVRSAGYVEPAAVIEARVAQTKRKMKLEPAEGLRVARYVAEDFPSMPETVSLSRSMPKTAVELVRSVHERGVSPLEAEKMARYMARLSESLKPKNHAALDENTSHVIGREWEDIDYRDENLDGAKQKRIYTAKGIPHFKDAATLEHFFRVESKVPYFAKVYQPEGAVP